MAIQWFPGHMTSARKKAAESMAQVDVVIEVVDARLPEASTNPMIGELRRERQRPCLKVLNKADLADPAVTKAWLEFYGRQKGVKAVALSCKKLGEAARIPSLCQGLAPHRDDNFKPLRMMIMGIPNVGKSTLMNALVKKRIAAVGDEPAVTKHQQRYELTPRQILIDTPGMMWPKIAHDSDGFMLAASHAIGRNAVLEEEVATFLAGCLLERYRDRLATRYKIDGPTVATLDAVGVLETVARKRGCIVRGKGRHDGEVDLEKASLIFLQDYRDGNFGRVSLETPESRHAMLLVAAERAKVAAPAGSDDPESDAERLE
jgi:ribosome biogenesis GTPase A